MEWQSETEGGIERVVVHVIYSLGHQAMGELMELDIDVFMWDMINYTIWVQLDYGKESLEHYCYLGFWNNCYPC